MQSIEQQIDKIEWQNDKGIDAPDTRTIAILVALNEIAEQLANINQSLNR